MKTPHRVVLGKMGECGPDETENKDAGKEGEGSDRYKMKRGKKLVMARGTTEKQVLQQQSGMALLVNWWMLKMAPTRS